MERRIFMFLHAAHHNTTGVSGVQVGNSCRSHSDACIKHLKNDWNLCTYKVIINTWSCFPRYKYTYMEEMLGNVAGSRQVFERWMEWQPEEQAWHSYINFELRYKEVDRARTIYERYILFSAWSLLPKFRLLHFLLVFSVSRYVPRLLFTGVCWSKTPCWDPAVGIAHMLCLQIQLGEWTYPATTVNMQEHSYFWLFCSRHLFQFPPQPFPWPLSDFFIFFKIQVLSTEHEAFAYSELFCILPSCVPCIYHLWKLFHIVHKFVVIGKNAIWDVWFKYYCFFNVALLVIVHPDVKNWIKYARFEEKHCYFAHARKVYERAVEFFGEDHMDEHLYVAFAKFEENQKEVRLPYVRLILTIPTRFLFEYQTPGCLTITSILLFFFWNHWGLTVVWVKESIFSAQAI